MKHSATDFSHIDILAEHWELEMVFKRLDRTSLGSWAEGVANDLLKLPPQQNFEYDTSEGQKYQISWRYVRLRAKCEQYAKSTNSEDKHILFNDIKSIIQDFKSSNKDGTVLPYKEFYYGNILKQIYSHSDLQLKDLFAEYLPVPKSNFFSRSVPEYIKRREAISNHLISDFLNRNAEDSLSDVEKKVTKIQRLIRAGLRHDEESKRVSDLKRTSDEAPSHIIPPYIPQGCSIALSERIISMAGKIKFIKTIRHYTNINSIESIFNEGLFGQKTLLNQFIPFKQAALQSVDLKEGDGNAICFGAGHGSVQLFGYNMVELVLDFDKMDFGPRKAIHCAFFKQLDFHYQKEKTRIINTKNNKKILFDHTQCIQHDLNALMLLCYSRETIQSLRPYQPNMRTASVPRFKLISYDINNIDNVLILNFFRFLDALDNETTKKDIYDDIEKMTDEELADFLNNVGQNLSDTMEFNFYGAHRIDFDSLVSLRMVSDKKAYDSESEHNGEVLKISELIDDLRVGKTEKLQAAIQAFPNIFQSYRFLAYLTSKTDNEDSLKALFALDNICDKPDWHPVHRDKDFRRKRPH